MFPSFSFFLLSAFFCLSFSSLPLLFDILKPKKVPGGVSGNIVQQLCTEHKFSESQGTQKICAKLVREPPSCCAARMPKLCSHNFHAIFGRDDSLRGPENVSVKFRVFFLNLDNEASCTGSEF